MKKQYFLIIAFLVFGLANAQIINFPDVNFKQKLLNYQPLIDTNFNGQIDFSEALSITTLDFTTSQNQFPFTIQVTNLTGIEYFTNLTTLKLSNIYLSSLNITNLTNLQTLFITNNIGNLNNIILTGLTNLKYLTINQIQSLNSLNLNGLINIEELDISSTALTSLNVFGLNNIKKLHCSYNQLNEIVGLSSLSSLEDFSCPNNLLTSIDLNSLINLTRLEIGNNLLTSIDLSSLVNITELNFSNNLLISINLSSQNNLINLFCGGNQLTELDLSNQISLKVLNVYENQLTSINLSSLIALQAIECGNNQLSTLNLNASPNLQHIGCEGNLFTNISDLNMPDSVSNNIAYLAYGNPQFQTVDFSQFHSISYLSIKDIPQTQIDLSNLTNLENIIVFNTSLTQLDFSNNPLITIFNVFENPNLIYFNAKNGTPLNHWNCNIYQNPNLEFVCANATDLDYVLAFVNQGTGSSPNVHVNTYCSFNPGGIFYTLQGNDKFDSNSNGCDTLDLTFPDLKFTISDGVLIGSIISNNSGNYSIPVQAGTYNIIPIIENPTYFNVSPTTATVTFPTQNSPFTQDFCIIPNGTHNDLEITLIPINTARPGFDNNYKIIYKNKGTNTQSGTVNLTFIDSVLHYIVANPATTNQTVNNLNWSFSNLQPSEKREISVTLNLNSPLETPSVNVGYVLNYTATIIASTDETPLDNVSTLNQTVVNSLDPNDKTCLEGTTILPSQVGKEVHYMIRFENTGTANAQNIVVKDIIDTTKFDVATLIPVSGSHSFVTKITDTNKVEFIFENIQLPFDDANNDGFVVFKIKTKPNLVIGDTFSNTASIYFDYNFPIITGPAITTVANPLADQDFEFESYFSVNPNPAENQLNIITKQNISISSISIYNTLGQLVQVIPNAKVTSIIDVSSLKSGNYFIQIITQKGTSTSKFIKE